MDNSSSSTSAVPAQSAFATIRTFMPYMWPQNRTDLKRTVLLAMMLLFGSKITNIFVPILYKFAVDSLSTEVSTHEKLLYIPILLIIGYGLTRVSAQVFGELKDTLLAKVTQHAVRTIALRTFNHVHNLSLRFHLNRKTGSLNNHITKGVSSIETFLRFTLFNIVPTFIEILLVSIVLWTIYEPIYAIITIITLVIYITFTIRFTEWRTTLVRKIYSVENEANAVIVDSLLNYETVKYYGNEQHQANKYDQSLSFYQRASVESARSLSILNIVQGIIISTGLVTIMIMAAHDVKTGSMTIGDFVVVNTYFIQLYLPLNILGFAYREIKLALINMESMFKILEQPQEVTDHPQAKTLLPIGGQVEFKNVSFAYDTNRAILKNISFKIPAGTTTAIVGSSGAGKSTISRLLFRFYDVSDGAILIDNQDIREITQHSLRSVLGMVPQDTVLFNETILYNIAYGRTSAERHDIEAAAKQAAIHEFILSLPEGYDTAVGERGLKLSGGEKQRIAIARTLLKQASIFVFDEATSALDSHTEKSIQQALHQISANHTTLVIAHRLSTIVDAHEILVFDQGIIKERGNHQTLLMQKGLYHSMWYKQQQTDSN